MSIKVLQDYQKKIEQEIEICEIGLKNLEKHMEDILININLEKEKLEKLKNESLINIDILKLVKKKYPIN